MPTLNEPAVQAVISDVFNVLEGALIVINVYGERNGNKTIIAFVNYLYDLRFQIVKVGCAH